MLTKQAGALNGIATLKLLVIRVLRIGEITNDNQPMIGIACIWRILLKDIGMTHLALEGRVLLYV